MTDCVIIKECPGVSVVHHYKDDDSVTSSFNWDWGGLADGGLLRILLPVPGFYNKPFFVGGKLEALWVNESSVNWDSDIFHGLNRAPTFSSYFCTLRARCNILQVAAAGEPLAAAAANRS